MTGNTGNTGNAGISRETGGGWVTPERADLPFVTEVDSFGNEAGTFLRHGLGKSGFPDRSWTAKWNAWLVLQKFVEVTPSWTVAATTAVDTVWTPINQATTDAEIEDLVRAARDERAEALGEILSQDVEFISDFMGLLTITPGSHPHTYRVIHIASLIGSYAALYFKGDRQRPRPSHICPALRPPMPVPGTPRFPAATRRRPT